MIRALVVVLALLILGDAIARGLSLPVPGSALGLLTLALGFAIRGGPDQGTSDLFDLAMPCFPLCFVPAGVGVIASLDVISAAWLYIATAIFLGTSATLVITGLVFQFVMRWISIGERA